LAFGLDCDRVIASAFAIGSALVAIAAILSGYDTDLTPLMGFKAILMGVVAVIVGGIGSIPGAFLGGLLVSSIQQVAAFELPIQLQYGVLFAVLILFLLLRPQGIFGRPPKRASV
jgi:branched-chain amino acid transport system permease protein